jgi:hypothetical protein
MQARQEGVIKFDLRYTRTAARDEDLPAALNAWRNRFRGLGLIGQHAERYDGAGYGNVSRRTGPADAPAGRRRFVISGTQTGALAQLDARHYCVVTAWDLLHNRVTAHGPVRPSSEALTHGAIYDQDAGIQVVLHVHSPDIWHAARRLDLVCSDPAIAYGTPEMGGEISRLFRESALRQTGILIMGGHEDGVIAFGQDEQTTGHRLLQALERSRRHDTGSRTRIPYLPA